MIAFKRYYLLFLRQHFDGDAVAALQDLLHQRAQLFGCLLLYHVAITGVHVDAMAAIHVDNATPISIGFLGTSHIFEHILFHLVEHGCIASARHVLCFAVDDSHSRVALLGFYGASNQHGVVVIVALDG